MLRTYLAVQSLSNVVSALGFTLTTAIRALGSTPVTEDRHHHGIGRGQHRAQHRARVLAEYGRRRLGARHARQRSVLRGGVGGLPRSQPQPSQIARAFDDGCARRSGEVIGLGIAQGGPQILSSITGAAINSAMAAGGMGRVAAWGAAQRVYSVAIMPLVGSPRARKPILHERPRRTLRARARAESMQLSRLSCFTGAILTALVLFFGRAVCAPLAPEPSVLDLASRYCSACCIHSSPWGWRRH